MKKKLILLPILFLLLSCTIQFGVSNSSIQSNISASTSVSIPISIISNQPSISYDQPITNSISQPTITSDPYKNTDSDDFYNNYFTSTSYEDSHYRTLHGFMSGDITPQTQIPSDNALLPKDESGKYYRLSNCNYTYDDDGNYLSYTINRIDGSKGNTIYYGGAYTSLEEVAAYLLAFGEVPPNSNYYSDEQSEAIETWGEYGRVNKANFSNDVDLYKYEPELPNVSSYTYIETDFGTEGFKCGEGYPVREYNDGYSITRGAARFVFISRYKYNGREVPFEERKVFYTYNHYNDFQEYLNYEGGWGEMFGFTTAGNDYCSGRSEYSTWEQEGKYIIPPTEYPDVTDISISELRQK